MKYKIREWLVDKSKWKLKCPYSMQAKFFVIHNTSNDASAHNEVSYMRSNNNATSFHLAVDDKEVVIGIPFNRNAWATGDGSGVNSGNRNGIQIEICYSKSGGERYKQAEDNTAHYIAQQLKARGWGIDKVKKHHDFPRPKDGYRKNCPHRILDEGRWVQFLEKVKSYMNEKEGEFMTPEQRKQMQEILKRAAKKGIIKADVHTDKKINGYSDQQLVKYVVAATNRVL